MKKAFTMIELVFVLVVVGIIAAMIAPNFQNTSLREAANQIISHIRYTQHLAMMNDKYNINDSKWYKGRWQLLFGKSSSGTKNTDGEYAYSIFSDSPSYSGNPGTTNELAKNYLDNNKFLSGGYSNVLDWQDKRATREMNVGKKYGISQVNFSGGCSSGKRIAFDYLGRPIQGNLSTSASPYESSRLVTTPCDIFLSDGTKNITIQIEPETGYAHVL